MKRGAEMNSALERLRAERIGHRQTSEYQIKVGPYNFYPTKGKIFVDGEQEARPERGLDYFITLLRKLKDRSPRLYELKETSSREPVNGNGFDIIQAVDDPNDLIRRPANSGKSI